MQDKPKFCKDCKYFLQLSAFSGYCKHPNSGFDLVTGNPHLIGAHNSREDDSLCGEAAKWFEDRPPKPVPPPTTETVYESGGVYSNNQAVEEKPWYKFW